MPGGPAGPITPNPGSSSPPGRLHLHAGHPAARCDRRAGGALRGRSFRIPAPRPPLDPLPGIIVYSRAAPATRRPLDPLPSHHEVGPPVPGPGRVVAARVEGLLLAQADREEPL